MAREATGAGERSVGRSLMLLLASLLVTLGSFEAGTRLLSTVGPSLLVVDAARGKHWLDAYQADVFVPEAGRRVHLRFHRDGFRGPERTHDKPAGVRRIAVLGDSMIAAVAVDEPLTLVGRLEAALNGSQTGAERASGRFEVMNFGVSSASSGQELVTYRTVARRYRPDLVVLAFNAANDLADNCQCLSRAHRLYFELDASGRLSERRAAPPAAGVGAWLDRHSRFYIWQKEAIARLRAGLRDRQGGLEPGNEAFFADGDPRVETAWRITAALLETLQVEAARDGARLALLLVPAPEQVYDDLWERLRGRAGQQRPLEREQPARRLAGMAASLGLPFLDLGPALRAAAPHASSELQGERVFFEGRFHLNERGNQVAAEAVLAWLAPLLAAR